MTMPTALHKQFRLHARKINYHSRVQTALKTIETHLAHSHTPYIAVSGGKDSTVLLALCRHVNPKLDAVHLDMNAAYPETDALLATYSNLHRIAVMDKLAGFKSKGIRDRSTSHFNNDWMRDYPYDGYFYGLRAEEAAGRRKLLQMKGKSFQLANGYHVCQPIVDWTYEDVWAYIVTHNLQYNALYDGMWDRPKHSQRVSSFGLSKALNYGPTAYMKMTHPELFNVLIQHTDEFKEYV